MSDRFNALRSSVNQSWGTPNNIFEPLNIEFKFTVDAAADENNALLPKYWTELDDGLIQNWNNEIVWCNPPYGKLQIDFIRKAASSTGTSVLLIPARTDTKVWHECIHNKSNVEIRFVKGRIKFKGASQFAPFASAVVIFNPSKVEKC
jgi:phage N-6-adenine-methyltransferase